MHSRAVARAIACHPSRAEIGRTKVHVRAQFVLQVVNCWLMIVPKCVYTHVFGPQCVWGGGAPSSLTFADVRWCLSCGDAQLRSTYPYYAMRVYLVQVISSGITRTESMLTHKCGYSRHSFVKPSACQSEHKKSSPLYPKPLARALGVCAVVCQRTQKYAISWQVCGLFTASIHGNAYLANRVIRQKYYTRFLWLSGRWKTDARAAHFTSKCAQTAHRERFYTMYTMYTQYGDNEQKPLAERYIHICRCRWWCQSRLRCGYSDGLLYASSSFHRTTVCSQELLRLCLMHNIK